MGSPPASPPRRSEFGIRAQQVLLIALMAVGSAVMWLVWPIGLIYAASLMSDSTQPTLGPIMFVVIALPIGMVLIGKLLARLDHRYGMLMGTLDDRPYRGAWTRSMRGERESTRRKTVLDTVMIVSVVVAGALMAIWFFLIAGSPLPR